MNINIEENDDIAIVSLEGNLDTNTAPESEERVNEIIENGSKNIIFDLTKTGFVSSAGLRIFLASTKKLSIKGGQVKLCGPNDVVKEILEISGFNTIMGVLDSVEKGIKEIRG
jgi:anti-sigma B factor antagonist